MPKPLLPETIEDAAKKKYIYQGPAAYYNPATKNWQVGTFTLHHKCIKFQAGSEANVNTTPYHLTLPFSSMSSIKKRMSCFIYTALVIEVGSESHWFSSFENRDSLYNMLELFWRSCLLSNCASSASSQPPNLENSSSLGKNLLLKLYESKATLINTAEALEDQNRQLSEAQQAIYDLNADLKTAEKLLDPNHQVANIFQDVSGGNNHPIIQSAKSILNCSRKYKITFNKNSGNDFCPTVWKKGFLLVGDKDFQVTQEESDHKFCIPYDEVTEIIVVSQWEIRVNQLEFGSVETSFNILCPAMVKLSKTLSSYGPLSSKLMQKDDVLNAPKKSGSPECLSSSSSSSLSSISIASCSSTDITQLVQQVQKMKSSGTLMEEEVEEISNILRSITDLASEVNKEYESQMEKILQLVDEINKTELRLKSGQKMMNKIT